jgi:hypothetical protein
MDGAILTDVLDVLWQGDPAHLPEPNGLTVYEERQTIGMCPYNSKWARETWPETYALLMDAPVVCCGVMRGSLAAVTAYLHYYETEALGGDRQAPRRGFDSSILHGYVAWTRGAAVRPFLNAECMHLGYADPSTVAEDGPVVTCEGVTPRLVHQYNRHRDLTARIYERWT